MPKIPDREIAFAKEFLLDLNATKAAERAGYSKKSARSMGSQLMAKERVRELIQAEMNERSKRTQIDADKVLDRLDKIGDVDIAQAFDSKGYLLCIHDIPPEVRRCIKGIDVFEEFEGVGKDRIQVGVVRKISFWDKVKANELIGKHLKLWVDRLEVEDGEGRAERIQRARERALKGGK
jgi:phage terminase small subunit